jgi:membrane protease YdiL (CAAX protease family)
MCKDCQGRPGAIIAMRQVNVWTALGIWMAFCLGGALLASWQGYGGRAFAATLTTFAFLLLVTLLFAARGVAEGVAAKLGPGGGVLLGACVFLFYLLYLLGTGTLLLTRTASMAGLIFVPLGLALWAGDAAIGTWQDFLSLAGVWVFVKFSPSHWFWPYPGGHLAYVMTVLVAVNTALASFLLVRRAKGVGYSIGWGNRWWLYVVGSYAVFACIAIPLGVKIHFIAFGPQWHRWTTYAGLSVGILMFTAWPEELLFRGLLQNFLTRASSSDVVGRLVASVLFGFSHITNLGFPNWRYVLLASIAGIFYGWTWKKSGSIFASALVHAGVDATWHFFFRTP